MSEFSQVKIRKRDTTRITLNNIPFPFLQNNTQQVLLQFANPKEAFACFNQGIITFSLTFQNVVAGNQVTQTIPSLAAISTYILNLSTDIFHPEGEQNASQFGRGDLGYVISYIDRCSQQTVMQSYVENTNSKTFPANTTQISFVIPMSYLIDEFGLKRFLRLTNIRMQFTMKALANVFFAPNSPNFNITCPSVYIDYPSYIIEEIPKFLVQVDNRTWQIFDQPLATGATQAAYNLMVKGKVIRIIHWSYLEAASTTTNPGIYTYVPNQFSVVTYQQFQAGGGKVYPPNYSYSAVYDINGNEQNLNILYNELLGTTGKASAYENNSLDYVNWRDTNRFYGFMIDDDSVSGGQYPFNINFSTPIVTPCTHRVCVQYWRK
jgi:hypothetical protein